MAGNRSNIQIPFCLYGNIIQTPKFCFIFLFPIDPRCIIDQFIQPPAALLKALPDILQFFFVISFPGIVLRHFNIIRSIVQVLEPNLQKPFFIPDLLIQLCRIAFIKTAVSAGQLICKIPGLLFRLTEFLGSIDQLIVKSAVSHLKLVQHLIKDLLSDLPCHRMFVNDLYHPFNVIPCNLFLIFRPSAIFIKFAEDLLCLAPEILQFCFMDQSLFCLCIFPAPADEHIFRFSAACGHFPYDADQVLL